MSLLELEHVGKHYRRGSREHVVLHDVSLKLDPGELVGVWGMRRSGRSTLMRIAAGIEPPDTGRVGFRGDDVSDFSEDVLGGGIGYCHQAFRATDGETTLDQLTFGLLARGVASTAARSQARAALARTGAERCGPLVPNELDSAETIRVSIARVLAFNPQLLVVDEPTKGVDLLARDDILLLLRSLADEGIAILTSTGEATGLAGADRALALGEGELRGHLVPELAPVVALHPAKQPASA
jgi:ABC-type multidrug transport system ATPase subunit